MKKDLVSEVLGLIIRKTDSNTLVWVSEADKGDEYSVNAPDFLFILRLKSRPLTPAGLSIIDPNDATENFISLEALKPLQEAVKKQIKRKENQQEKERLANHRERQTQSLERIKAILSS